MRELVLYWGLMIIFYIIASRLRSKKEKFGFVDELLNIVIYAICLLMGLRMGANEEVTSQLGTIGVQALIICAFCVIGSMFFVYIGRKILRLGKDGGPVGETLSSSVEEINEEKADNSDNIKSTIIILSVVAIGMLAGYFVIPELFESSQRFDDITSPILVAGIAALLALVGFTLGLSGGIIENMKTVGLKVLVFPVAAISGSFAAAIVYSYMSPLTMGESLAAACGFGWYTFAPGVIIDAGHALAGAICFMANVIRETLGIIIIPLATKKIGALEATAIPGVAAMDVCVPIVARSNKRPEVVVYSFAIGFAMALCVPVLVPIFIGA